MILKKVILKNFRQFRGIQKIDFAFKKNGENITVIFGENGRGKTGIYRAMIFCLYGERRLSQDAEIGEKELSLVNVAELQNTLTSKEPVETFVELEFSHNKIIYTLKRQLFGIINGEVVDEEVGEVKLAIQGADGNTKIIHAPDEIALIINSILDKRVKEYFLFDGEKIERLTRASREQRKEISRGVRNLLNIDSLETSIKAIKYLKKSLDNELRKKSQGEYGQLLQKIKEIEDLVEKEEGKLTMILNESELAFKEKKALDKELAKYEEIKSLIEDREKLEKTLEIDVDKSNKLLDEMRLQIGKASILLVMDTIEKVYGIIEERRQRGEIPSEIRKDLIERILSEEQCICGREIPPGSQAFDQIIQWKNKTADFVIQDSVIELWRYLSSTLSHKNNDIESVENKLQEYGINKNDIERTLQRIEALNIEIGDPGRGDISELEKQRAFVEKKIIEKEAERLVTNNKIKDQQQELESSYAKRIFMEKDEGLRNELSLRSNLSKETYEALELIHKDFTNEIRAMIGKSATDVFSILVDPNDRETLNKIIVREDYSLQILDKYNKPFLANISAGQRQILSISFIAALAKAATKDGKFKMPLFMDTPFGRLSFVHRKNLINKVPNFSAQWILLATDTELTKQEAGLLRKGKKWGKFYMLRPDGPGSTRIVEYPVEHAMSYLNENMNNP